MAIRITGGEWGGRFIDSPEGRTTRPTSAISRQALCNILADRIEGAHILDLFAGSGVVSAEFLSRGAAHSTLVEKAKPIVALLRKNFQALNANAKVLIQASDVLQMLAKPSEARYDIIYADPPFTEGYPDLRPALAWLKEGGVAIFEMPSRSIPEWADGEKRKYGESTLVFFHAPVV